MGIDAKIRNVVKTPDGDLVLELEPRYDRTNGQFTVSGVSHLLIEQPTWTPTYGMAIWGGADTVTIEVSHFVSKRYRRTSVSRLKEKQYGEVPPVSAVEEENDLQH